MPTQAISTVPPGRQIFTGPKGGQFFLNDQGKRVYLTASQSPKNRSFRCRRGAFLRFIENQANIA